MGLLNVVRSAVKTVDKATRDLQSTTLFRKYVSSSGSGAKIYNPPISSPAISLKAIVEDRQEMVRTLSGELSQSKTSIEYLDISALLSATNSEGVKENDLIVLQNGETGRILAVGGFIDAGTGIPIATTVFMG